MENYPHELRVTPLPVVALVGQGKFQDTIKEGLLEHNIKALCYDITDPIAFSSPPKRQNYDGYVAKGILKANWMHKMINVNSAAIAIIIPWCNKEGRDEKGRQWHTREPDLLIAVENIRKNYQHFRNPNHIVFIVTLASGLNLNETTCVEKIGFFRRKIEYSEKYFFILSEDDLSGTSLTGTTTALKELAFNYYLEEARRLKKEKDLISRKVQPLVYVRHHWKVAFLSEFRNDTHAALKYYTAAYGYLRDIPKEFQLEAKYGVSEAVGQFQRHMKVHKKYLAGLLTTSEHWGWVSRQYQVLGELLEEYSPSSLWISSNASYNHPAFYFHAAATYATLRKKKAFDSADRIDKELIEKFRSLGPIQLASVDISKQQFVGQLSIDQSEFDEQDKLSLADWTRARRAAREFHLPHSRRIIDLLQKAHCLYSTRSVSGQKGTGPCRRMKLFLMYEMAEECFSSGAFDRAKEYFDVLRNSVISKEDWKLICATVLKKSLDCALQLKDTKNLIDSSLELCFPDVPISIQDKETIQSQLMYTMLHLAKFSLPSLTKPHQIIIKQSKHPLMQVNCHFEQRNVHTKHPLVIRVQVISSFPLPIRFHSLVITFTDDEYNSTITDNGPPIAGGEAAAATEDNLVVLPHIPRVFEFRKTAKTKCDLEFKSIEFCLGDESQASVSFLWNIEDWKEEPEVALLQLDSDFIHRTSTCIVDPPPKLDVELKHLPPALVYEYYRIQVKITNAGDKMQNGTLFLIDPTGESNKSQFFTESLQPINETEGIEIEAIPIGGNREIFVFFTAQFASKSQSIATKLVYSTPEYNTQVSKQFAVPVILTLSSRCAFFSRTFAPCVEVTGNSTTIRAGEAWVMRVEVRNNCPYPIEVVETSLKLNENATLVRSTSDDIFAMGESSSVLCALDKFTSWFRIVPSTFGKDISIGQFEVKWKRSPHGKQLPGMDEDNERVVLSPTLIPAMNIERPPFTTKIIAPSRGLVGIPIKCTCEISNLTPRIEEFSFTLTDTTNFLLAGNKAATFKILPFSSYEFVANIVPLKSGKVSLPTFQIASKRFAQQLAGAKQKHYIFVNPRNSN